MHIVQATGLVSLKYGALERSFVRLAAECNERGHRVTCVWEATPDNKAFLADFSDAGGVNLVIPSQGRPVSFVRDLTSWLRANKTDVVHGHFNPVALLSLTSAWMARVPVRLSTVHAGFSPSEMKRIRPHQRVTILARSLLSDPVLVVSKSTLDQFVSLGLSKRKSSVFYLGIDPCPRVPSGVARQRLFDEFDVAKDAPIVMCTAFHDPIKGVDTLIEAIAILSPEYPELRLIQAGGSLLAEQTADLHRLANTLNVADNVVWAGQRNDVRELLSAADVYCQPSRSEGLGLAILEASQAGVAVVASKVGGIPEAVVDGETGLLVESESPRALADGIRTLLGDAPMRKKMGDAGRVRTERLFDLGRQTEFLVSLYERLVDGT